MNAYHNPELVAALTARGLTYKDAAEYLGTSVNTFHKKVQGRRSWKAGEYERLEAWLGLAGKKGRAADQLNAETAKR